MFSALLLTAAISFQAPAAPTGPACRVAAFDAMAFYTGSWRVTMEARLSKQGPWETTAATSTIGPELAGCALLERLDTTRQGKPLQLLSILTYDQNGSKWQLTVTDSEHGRMQTYEGRDDGTSLVLLVTLEIPGGPVLLRRMLTREGTDAFRWQSARSTDEGKTWDVTTRMNYRRTATLWQPDGRQASAATTAERVEIPVPAGAALAGRYRDGGPGAPGVLLFPMCSPSGVDGWTPVAERLKASGVSSLMVAEPGYSPAGVRETRAGAAIAYLRSRVGNGTPLAVTGGSCSVALALGTAARHPEQLRAVVVLSGPYGAEQLEYVRKTPALAVFAGASEGEPPTPESARAMKAASANPASRVEIWTPRAHGTDYFAQDPGFAGQIADWLVQQLKGESRR